MADKKRILIFSASFCGGYRWAAEALKSYYEAHYASELDVEIVDFLEELTPALNVLAKFAYQQSAQFFPAGHGSFLEVSDKIPTNPVVHELRLTGLMRAEAAIDEYDPHAVISTFPLAAGVVADIGTNRPFVSAAVITDFDTHRIWLNPRTGIFFVASKEAREDLVVRDIPWDNVVVSGVPVHERFADTVQRVRCREEFGLSDRFTVLLTSIADASGDIKDLMRQLVGMGIQVVAVTGRNDRLNKRLASVKRESDLLRVFGFVEDMNRMMKAADVVVSTAGGSTVAESLVTQLPLIICNPVPGQEIHNVDFLVNYGAGLLVRDEDDVVEKVRFLSDHPGRLAQMTENAGSIGWPKAAQTVCERVLAEMR